MDVYKILVVGEPNTGKSTLIGAFFNCEQLADGQSRQTAFTKNLSPQPAGSLMDFVLKIINVKGRKVRVQLWDMAGCSDPTAVFSPLFVRNAVGCIVVARADDPVSLQE